MLLHTTKKMLLKGKSIICTVRHYSDLQLVAMLPKVQLIFFFTLIKMVSKYFGLEMKVKSASKALTANIFESGQNQTP
jgi:hypothetical protein